MAFFLDSSSPGVLDWARMFKSSLFHFQPTCISCYVSFHKGLSSHTYSLNTSQQAHVSGDRFISSRLHGVCSALLEETSTPCYAHFPPRSFHWVWFMSLGRVQPAPLIPLTLMGWRKGQGREKERQGHGLPSLPPASPSLRPREQPQSCLCSAFKLLASLPKSMLVRESPKQVLEFSCQN